MNTNKHISNLKINFNTTKQNKINATLKEIIFIEKEDKSTEIQAIIAIDKKTYDIIDENCVFNLQKQVRGQSSIEEFTTKKPIEIELKLRRTLYDKLETQKLTSPKTLFQYIEKIKNDNENDLLFSENWFALIVKQEVELPGDMEGTLNMGYQTTWIKTPEETPVNSKFFNQIVDFFNANTLNCEVSNPNTNITFQYSSPPYVWYAGVKIKEEFKQVILRSQCPYKVQADKRDEMCKKLTDINYDLPIGNFEMNQENGLIFFKTYLEAGSAQVTTEMLKLLLEANVYTLTKYIPEIEQIVR